MKHKPPTILIIIVFLALVGGGGYWYFSNNPVVWQQAMTDFGLKTTAEENLLTASGFIEANQVTIAAEAGGRIISLNVDQGDSVSAGQIVAEISTDFLDAQSEQINAQIALAKAQLAQISAGVPTEQIAIASAALSLAEADRDAAKQAIADAELLRDSPQQLNAQIDAAYSKIAIIDLQIKQAELMQNAVMLRESVAEQMWDSVQRGYDWSMFVPGVGQQSGHIDFGEGEKNTASTAWNLATMDVWQVSAQLESAQAARKSAVITLNNLLDLKENPLQANLKVTQAEANYQTKLAAVDVAKANLAQAKSGVPQSRIEIVQANLTQAQTQLDALAAQREKFTLTAPIDGVVTSRPTQDGEVALPGMPLMTIADLSKMTLTVYVAEDSYGQLQLGQSVQVTVDSFPDEKFSGKISYISDTAEFTPKNVQTKEERVSLVYAIKIDLDNTSGKLKAGMPADAIFN